MFNRMKNHLIRFLIKHSYIDTGVCYAVVAKIPQEEMKVYYELYKSAKGV